MPSRAPVPPVVVRAPKYDLTATKKILELGPDGIIFPMVTTAEEAERVISSTLYPPSGDRGFGPMNAMDYGFRDPFEYTKSSLDSVCRFIQIEHKDTIENLDSIMKNKYIYGYIWGPNDLCGSHGMLSEMFTDKITAIIRETTERLHSAGKYVGIASGGYSDKILKHWSSFDPDMLCAGADFDFVRDGARTNRINMEKIFKNK